MKLKNVLFGSAGILSATVISIAIATIYFLNSVSQLTKNADDLVQLRVSALNSKYFVVEVQQYLTDASLTGDEEGIASAKENLEFLLKELNTILTLSPDLKNLVMVIERESRQFFEVGAEMVQAYKKGSVGAGNSIMKREGTGFDAVATKLNEELEKLDALASQREIASEKNIQASHDQLLLQTILLSLIEFIVMLGSFFMIYRRTKPLEGVVNELGDNATHLESATQAVASSANELSSANSQQAAATQETAASLEEIRSMVGKTAENSHFLQSKAQETNQSVTHGKEALDAVLKIIQDIKVNQAHIAHSVEQTNQEISQIVSLITEIGSKTKVINEIVFQTKLLSFNASVEAARAGEHGRGFAVVAEEVGGLAQMSGTASKEISDLLDSSVKRVESIIQEGRHRLDATLAESSSKIDLGVSLAHQCEESFETIVNQMHSVSQITDQTTGAIQETVHGLDEISKALQDLDQSTRSNADTSQATSQTSLVLEKQLVSLKDSLSEIQKAVLG